MSPTDHSASHYLRIYKIKLDIAENRRPHPYPAFVDLLRELVRKLSAMDPSAPVRLDVTTHLWRFSDARTGDLFAEFEPPPDV
jgi:hypothetical protein